MPRQALSDEEVTEFRERAISVAERLFAKGGVEGVTMRALSKKLRCSPMTPYRYFENQEHLLAEVRASAFRSLAEDQAGAEALGEGPLDTIRHLRKSYIAFGRDNPHLYSLMFSVLPPKLTHPELEAAAAASFLPLRGAVTRAIEAKQLKGDALTLAHLIWAEMHGLVSLHASNKLNFGCSLQDLAELSLLSSAR
jgi:AcrR family transcriptional regulator